MQKLLLPYCLEHTACVQKSEANAGNLPWGFLPFLYFSFSGYIFLFYVNGFALHVYLCITCIQNSGRLEEGVRSPEIGSTENYIHPISTERT